MWRLGPRSANILAMRVAASSLDITPTTPVVLASGPDLSRRTGRVFERLEANVAVLHDDRDRVTVLITVDLLYPGPALRRAIEAALPDIPPSRILLGASHTHRGPSASPGLPGLGQVDQTYLRDIAGQLCETVRTLVHSTGQEVDECHVGVGQLDHSINRRRRHGSTTRMGPNLDGVRDETCTTVRVSASGKIQFILWNYACHPVSHPETSMLSAHYPHVVRRRLREKYGLDVPVLFLQGFSGNTRPNASMRISRPRDVLRRLKWGPSFHDLSHSRYRKWCDSLADSALRIEASASLVEINEIQASRSVVPLRRFVELNDGDPREANLVSFQKMRLGRTLTIVGASAEVVSEYSAWIRDQLPAGEQLICAGCLDDTFGYIPTEQMLREGGYEPRGFCSSFGYQAVKPGVEVITKNAFASLNLSHH